MRAFALFLCLAAFPASPSRADDWADCTGSDYDLSIKACTAVIKANKVSKYDLSVAFNQRAESRRMMKDHIGAVADYNQSISIDGKSDVVFSNRAYNYLDLENYDAALADFNQALRLSSNNMVALTGRGLAWEKNGDVSKAREDFTAALALPAKGPAGEWAQKKARKSLEALEQRELSVPARQTEIQQPSLLLTPTPALPPLRRVALVIGVDAYQTAGVSRLNNSVRDAKSVAALLGEHGFNVTVKTDLDFATLNDQLAIFHEAAIGADMAFIYFAGHGFANGGADVIAPKDIGDPCARPLLRAVDVEALAKAAAPARLRLLILDACRNQASQNCPTRGDEDGGFRNLGRVSKSGGVVIINSTRSGATASDGRVGEGSPFANALIAKLKADPKRNFYRIYADVSKDVQKSSKQTPSLIVEGDSDALDTCLAGANCAR